MTKKIPLSQGIYRPSNHKGLYALVDDEDRKWLNQWNWTAIHTQRRCGGYAMRTEYGKTILMHRLIMNAPDDMEVDHINGNGLDNRRANLRVVTLKTNRANRRKGSNNTSGYKGVFRVYGKWRMQFAALFDTPEEAALAYDKCASAIHGEHAGLNFPDGKQPALIDPEDIETDQSKA